MVRTIVTPREKTISINIPEDYIGKQIEVIAFEKDEGIAEKAVKKVSFTALSIDTQGFVFNREEANER